MKHIEYKIGHTFTFTDGNTGLITDVRVTKKYQRLYVVKAEWEGWVHIRRETPEPENKGPAVCTKIFYYSKYHAELRLKEIRRQIKGSGGPQSVYLCPICKRYHLTSQKK